jgi:hypothetical protein
MLWRRHRRGMWRHRWPERWHDRDVLHIYRQSRHSHADTHARTFARMHACTHLALMRVWALRRSSNRPTRSLTVIGIGVDLMISHTYVRCNYPSFFLSLPPSLPPFLFPSPAFHRSKLLIHTKNGECNTLPREAPTIPPHHPSLAIKLPHTPSIQPFIHSITCQSILSGQNTQLIIPQPTRGVVKADTTQATRPPTPPVPFHLSLRLHTPPSVTTKPQTRSP